MFSSYKYEVMGMLVKLLYVRLSNIGLNINQEIVCSRSASGRKSRCNWFKRIYKIRGNNNKRIPFHILNTGEEGQEIAFNDA